jgi:hypothetical protein
VTFASILAYLLMLFGFASAQPADGSGIRQVMVDDQLIVRVPVRALPPQQVDWLPAREVKCLQVSAIRGAMLSGPEQIDVLLTERRRVRAHFSADCPALDFYDGFYLKPADSRLCAGRDTVYSRMGGTCRVERMQLLSPRLKR